MDRIKELIDTYRYQIILSGLVILLILAFMLLSGNYFKNSNDNINQIGQSEMISGSAMNSSSQFSGNSVTSESSISPGGKIIVDIKGAIKHPGIYKVESETRVSELVDLAGGFSKSADHQNVNLAQRLNDQQVVYIPLKGEIKGNVHLEKSKSLANDQVSSTDSISNSGNSNGKININTADKVQLQTISGIGDKKAENIINYRQQNGGFKSIEDIKNADGIGDKMFENIKENITV